MFLRIVSSFITGPNSYVYKSGLSVPAGTDISVTTSDQSTTMVVAFKGKTAPSDIGIAHLPIGYRYSDRDSVSSHCLSLCSHDLVNMFCH